MKQRRSIAARAIHRLARRAIVLCLVACAAVAGCTEPAAAQNLYWTGGSFQWSDSARWSTSPTLSPTGFTPTSSSNVITSTNAWTITVPTGTSFANSFLARSAGNLRGTGTATSRLVLGAGGISMPGTGFSEIGSTTAGSNLSIALAASQAWNAGSAGNFRTTVNAPVSRQTGATQNMTLNLFGTSAIGASFTISSAISNGGASGNLGVWVDTATSVTFSAAQAYTGDTTVQRGLLLATGGFLPSASRLVMGSGMLSLSGSANATSVQTVASTTIRPGFGTVVLNPGASGTVRLEMGAISRSAGGGIVSFGTNAATVPGPSRIFTTSNTDTNGILGPWAITGRNPGATDLGNQYVRVGAGGVLETLTYSGTSVINDLTDATANYQIAATGTLTANRTANTIYIPNASVVTFSLGAYDLTLNGISRRQWSPGQTGALTISSAGGRVVIGASNELVLAYGDFSVTAPIVDGTAAGRVVLGSMDYVGHGSAGWSNQHTFSGGLTFANGGSANTKLFNFGTADGSATASPFGTGTLTISGDPTGANLTGGGRIGTNNAQIWDVDFTFTGTTGTGLHMGTGPVSLGLGAGPTRNVGVTGTVTVGGNVSDGTYETLPVTSLTKSGTGLLVLSGSLLYTGSTGVSAGTLLISGTNPSTMGPMSASGGILQFARPTSLYNADTTKYTAANLTTGSAAVLAVNAGGSGEFTSSDLDILKGLGTELTGFLPGSFLGIDPSNASSGTFTYSSNIANTNSGSNALGIAKVGGGTLVLSGSNSFTGGVSVRGGRLLLTAANQIGTGPMTLVSGTLSTSSDAFMTSAPLRFAGGLLEVTGTTLTSLNAGRTTTFTAATPVTLDITDSANAFEVSQVLNQTTGNLVKLGAGTLVVSSSNTYTGTTVIGSAGGPTGGTLRLSAAGWISGTSGTAAPLIYSGTLDTNGINVTTAAFTLGGGAAATTAGVTTGSGTVTLGGNVTFDATNNPGGATIAGNLNLGSANRTFTVGDSTGASNDLTISAAITSGSLTKAGAGTLLLSGSNSYAGTTTGTGGVLQFANKNALYGGTTASWTRTNITVNLGATLAVNVGDSGDLFTDANVATLLSGIGGTINNNGLRAGSNIGFDTTNATSGTFTLGTVVANTTSTGGGAVGLAKVGAGTLVVQGANTFTGTTFIGTLGGGNAGILRLASTGSISGIATVYGGTLDFDGNSRTLTALNLGGGGAGSAASILTGAGTLTLNGNALFDATNNPNGATISGNLSLNNAARTFTVGDATAAAADLTIDALISGGGASGALTKAGAGRLVLSNAANSFAGKTAIQAGTVEFSSIANVNGGPSALGAPTSVANGTIDIGSGTIAATFRYSGTGSSTTDRVINLAGTTGGATIDASGAGPLVLNGGFTYNATGNKTLTLAGSSTSANSIGALANPSASATTSLLKMGFGRWTLTAASTFTGSSTILDGTMIVATNAPLDGNGAFGYSLNGGIGGGSSPVVVLGDESAGAAGSAAMLLDNGAQVGRLVMIPALGVGGSQKVVVGGANTTGTTRFQSTMTFFVNRDVTLQSASGGTVDFANGWLGGQSGAADALTSSFTVGSVGNNGVVLLSGNLATSGSVTVNYGMLHARSTLAATAGVTVSGSTAELKYNGTLPLDSPLYLVQGTLSGTGTINALGGVTAGSNVILSPGNSPGIQSFTTGLTWASGGTYLWEVNNWATPGTAGTDYDQIQVSGSPLDIASTSGSTFRIAITSLTASNTTGLVPGFDPYASQTFTIATSGLGVTGFDASKFTLDTTGFANSLAYGGFWISTDSGSSNVYLNYTPTATYTLAASAGASTMIVGGTTTIAGIVTNTGTGGADSIDYSGFSAASLSGTLSLSPSSGVGLSSGASGTSTSDFTTATPGSYTFTPAGTFTNTNLGTPAVLSGSAGTTTVTVLQHSNAAFALVSGGTQTIITGGTFSPVVFNLTNAGANRSPLDVGSLVNLTGSTGSAVVASGGTASYAGTGFDTVTVGTGTLSMSLDAGDDQDLPGASALQTYSASTTYTVLDHSYASFVSGTDSGVLTIDFGTYDTNTQSWLSGTSTSGYALWNVATNYSDALTAGLALTGTSVSGDAAGFELGIATLFANLQSGSSNGYTALFDPSLSALVTGTQSATFTLAFADQSGLSGGDVGRSLTVNMNVIIVPEPTTLAMGAIGAAMAGVSYWRRRRAA